MYAKTFSDRVVMQSVANNQVGDSIPGLPTAGPISRLVDFVVPDPHSNPSEHKLLTPHPPPQKCDIQFQGIEASKSKNPLGDCFVGQNNDFTRGCTSDIMPWGILHESCAQRQISLVQFLDIPGSIPAATKFYQQPWSGQPERKNVFSCPNKACTEPQPMNNVGGLPRSATHPPTQKSGHPPWGGGGTCILPKIREKPDEPTHPPSDPPTRQPPE